MTIYIYKAKKTNAETVTGQIKAQNQDEAVDLIHQLGLTPIHVEIKKNDYLKSLDKKGAVRSKEIYIFSRQLSNMLRSGISLFRCLLIIEDQTHNLYFKKIISSIAQEVKNGRSFSDCLSQYPKIFSPLYVTMVHAGEESGNIQDTLISIASYQKRQEEVFSKIRSALAYPIFMALMGVATVFFILTFVAPKMAGLFQNLSELPLPTIILINISKTLSDKWYIFIVVLLFGSIGIRNLNFSIRSNPFFNRLVLHIPILGEIITKAELSRFCRALVLLLRGGVSIIRGLQISIPIVGNELLKQQLLKCKESLSSGGSFGDSIKNSKEIPNMMGHLIAIGEESGNLNDVLTEVADSFEQDIDERVKTLTSLIEPIMILIVGLLVGLIVFAMLLPIFQIDTMLK